LAPRSGSPHPNDTRGVAGQAEGRLRKAVRCHVATRCGDAAIWGRCRHFVQATVEAPSSGSVPEASVGRSEAKFLPFCQQAIWEPVLPGGACEIEGARVVSCF